MTLFSSSSLLFYAGYISSWVGGGFQVPANVPPPSGLCLCHISPGGRKSWKSESMEFFPAIILFWGHWRERTWPKEEGGESEGRCQEGKSNSSNEGEEKLHTAAVQEQEVERWHFDVFTEKQESGATFGPFWPEGGNVPIKWARTGEEGPRIYHNKKTSS